MQRHAILATALGAVLLAAGATQAMPAAQLGQVVPIEAATITPIEAATIVPTYAKRTTICRTGHLVARPRLPLEPIYGTWALESYGGVSTRTDAYTGNRTMVLAPDSGGGVLRISRNGTYYWHDGFGVVTSGRLGYFESGNCGLGKNMTHFAFKSALRTVYIMREPDGGVLIDSVPGELYQYESKRH